MSTMTAMEAMPVASLVLTLRTSTTRAMTVKPIVPLAKMVTPSEAARLMGRAR
jgi:hypothetical protein